MFQSGDSAATASWPPMSDPERAPWLHVEPDELAERRARTLSAMQAEDLAGMLLFRQESMYYLTGYDTMGFCFFQCLYLGADGTLALLTRSADLRQARHTSLIEDIRGQIKYSSALIDVNIKLLETGNIRITDLVLAINTYLNARNLLNQNYIGRLQIINQINYWEAL